MEIDPALVAVAGALSTIAGLFYRHLLKERDECKADAVFWRDKWLAQAGMTEIALSEAERRDG
jgi:hypothetical protein